MGRPAQGRANRGVNVNVKAGLLRLLPIAAALVLLGFPAGASAAGTFVVTNTNDSGDGSLRQAIIDANNAAGGTITFNIPGATPTIHAWLGAPADHDPGLDRRHLAAGHAGEHAGRDDRPGSIASGALLDLAPGSNGSTVHGLAFGGNTGDGGTTAISVESDFDKVTGNWIGVAADSSSLGLSDYGIEVTGNHNTIGGGTAADANVITGSGAADAISIDSPNSDTPAVGNVVQGNLLGFRARTESRLPDKATASSCRTRRAP